MKPKEVIKHLEKYAHVSEIKYRFEENFYHLMTPPDLFCECVVKTSSYVYIIASVLTIL